jgi:hypothetical protein
MTWMCSAERTDMLAGTKMGTSARLQERSAIKVATLALDRTSPLKNPNGLSRSVNRESIAPSEYDFDRKLYQICCAKPTPIDAENKIFTANAIAVPPRTTHCVMLVRGYGLSGSVEEIERLQLGSLL